MKYVGGWGESNTLSSCVAPKPRRSVSLMLLDAVCSYLCLITIYVLFRLFAFDQAARWIIQSGPSEMTKTTGNFSFREREQTLLERMMADDDRVSFFRACSVAVEKPIYNRGGSIPAGQLCGMTRRSVCLVFPECLNCPIKMKKKKKVMLKLQMPKVQTLYHI